MLARPDTIADPFAGLPRKHYSAIYADPPWAFQTWWSGRSTTRPSPKKKFSYPSRATEPAYEVMREDELNALPVGDLAADDCVLLMGQRNRQVRGRGMTDPHVTDHAVLRYFERALQFDIEDIRRHIAEQCRDAIRAGAASVIVGDIRFEFRDGVVVTVTLKSTGNGPSRARRETLARGKA